MTQPVNPTWDIVATVDEAPELLQAFVAWHLELGARTIHLYFDRGDDPSANCLEGIDRVRITRCDADYHGSSRQRPVRHQQRQIQNASDAYAESTADWLLHCDADEFLWTETSVSEVLGGVDASDALRVDNLERFYSAGGAERSIFDGGFRAPFGGTRKRGMSLFGEDYALTSRGLTGYANGKSFARTGQNLRLNIHKVQRRSDGRWRDVPPARTTALQVLHFDGLTPLGWSYKLLRKAHAMGYEDGAAPTPHRMAQVQAVLDEVEGTGAAHEIHDRLKRLDGTDARQLEKMGLRRDINFDPRPALSEWFPGTEIDLSPERHDAWLRREKARIASLLAPDD